MNETWRVILGWTILGAIIWDTVLTFILLVHVGRLYKIVDALRKLVVGEDNNRS